MRLIQRFKFKWREPLAFVKIRDAQETKRRRWWHGIATMTAMALLLMAAWYFATLIPENSPPPLKVAVLLAIISGAFCAYGAPRLTVLCSSEVKVGDRSLLHTRWGHRVVAWKNVSEYRFAKLESIDVLQLKLRNGGALAFGLDETIDPDELGRFLQSVGVPQSQEER